MPALSSIAELVHRLADQDKVTVKRASTGAHTVHIGSIASELDVEVGCPVVEHLDVHLALNRAFFIFRVAEGRLHTDGSHGDLGVPLTRERYLDNTE